LTQTQPIEEENKEKKIEEKAQEEAEPII